MPSSQCGDWALMAVGSWVLCEARQLDTEGSGHLGAVCGDGWGALEERVHHTRSLPDHPRVRRLRMPRVDAEVGLEAFPQRPALAAQTNCLHLQRRAGEGGMWSKAARGRRRETCGKET